MKNMKKILALLVAVLMIAASVSAFAAAGAQLAEAENTISATGVTAGDTVTAYQLVEWKNGDWALTTLGTKTGIELKDLIDGITEAEATTIAKALASDAATYTLEENNGTWSKTPVDAGMYYLKATANAEHKDIIYNPAFVSADYKEGGNTVAFTDKIGSSAVVKKSSVPFDKEITSEDLFKDTKPGDVIPYKVTTKIPSYGTTFTKPVFKITDTLSAGLTLEGDITVKYGTKTATATNADLTLTANTADGGGYVVEFSETYLKGLAGVETAVEITYSAKVTTAAVTNVTAMDNYAEVEFSHTPNETSKKDDITRHYTFTIDGNLLGGGTTETSELIKTAVDKDGKPIYEEKEKFYQQEPVNPLAGASFTLTPVNGTPGDAKTQTSDAHGRLNFKGLDAGTYELVENSAPTGFVKDSRTYVVTIIPHYNSETPDLLDSYDITFKIKDTDTVLTTSSFTMTNEGPHKTTSASVDTDASQFIGNTPGTELPSTGGIGTTLFYIGGGILVLAAVILLVTKRRMNAND